MTGRFTYEDLLPYYEAAMTCRASSWAGTRLNPPVGSAAAAPHSITATVPGGSRSP